MTDEFHKVTNLTDLPEGHAKVFQVGGKRLAVCHVESGCYAIDDICTHDGGPLGEGELVGNEIECPRHGARFDVKTGKAMCLPAVLPVRDYKVEIRNGDEIWIAVPVGVTGGA